MGRILLLIIIGTTGVTSLIRPYIGLLGYYLLALLGPQYIWWWNFEGLRVSFIVGLFAIVGVVLKILRSGCDFRFFKTKLNFYVLLLYSFMAISYFLGPFVSTARLKIWDPNEVFLSATKMFLFYFCATIVINDVKKLRYLGIIFIISTVYMIYWANNQYITGDWSKFNFGRLMGPRGIDGGGIYGDENAFAMLFVTGLPFIYFMGFAVNKKWLRYALWAVIPLGWHGVFLTGSRGGLIGLAVITLLSAIWSKKRLIGIMLMPLFIFAYYWQGGNVMQDRTERIPEEQGEASIDARLSAWRAGSKMIENHPITGVGLASFMSAFPYYSKSTPRIAHNTLIQFAAESGIGAGFCYLMIIITFFFRSRSIKKWSEKQTENMDTRVVIDLNTASIVSFTGLVTCSFFLSLNSYEIFFYLLIINNSLAVISSQRKLMTKK